VSLNVDGCTNEFGNWNAIVGGILLVVLAGLGPWLKDAFHPWWRLAWM
jgi:hypothetical protein